MKKYRVRWLWSAALFGVLMLCLSGCNAQKNAGNAPNTQPGDYAKKPMQRPPEP